uniref:Flavin-containing monooxygenase n=1 Tax=Tanacetum cinerariifolium TaxID=118510 RepID=A0A6L2LXX9_TANCI|nr:probable indole-3-pyruvate monooxygenase YUCCA10 [Tanacetum cinerariifolium]
MEDDYKPVVQSQRRVNPKIHDVIKKEVIKLFDAGMIYPISDSPWVSPIYCVPKKGGMTVFSNENNKLTPMRLVTGWRVCIDYRKLNDATRKDHFPLPFMDQMLKRLAGNEFYCFLDGFSGEWMVLGHKISKSSIEVDRAKVDTHDSSPGKETPFVFSKEYVDAFDTLKKKLTEASILVVPDWNLPFELMCDASNFVIDAVLGQRKTKHFQPIHYASKTMIEAQIHYTTTEKEMLAVIIRRCVHGQKAFDILKACHEGPTGGHHGVNLTVKKVFDAGFLWPSIYRDAHDMIKTCDTFDYLSKWVEAKALPTNDARVIVKFLKSLFFRFGIPRAIISDRGTHFCNDQFTREMIKYGRTVGENRASWSDKLDDALWAFRTAYKTPIGCTPYKLVYGKSFHLPIELEHRAYWSLKHVNLNLKTAGDHRKLQLNELSKDYAKAVKKQSKPGNIERDIERLHQKPDQRTISYKRIEHQTSTTRTPKQNGVVERRNRTLVEAARTMLSVAKISLFFGDEAIATTCFTQNRSLVIPPHEKTPYHIINGRKSSVKFFYIFGSLWYIIRYGENLDKMKEKGDACIFVGYSTKSRAYRVYNKRTRVIVETIHLNFDELPLVTSDHVSSDPAPQCPTTALEHTSLSPNPQSQKNIPQAAKTVTTSNELDLLFSPMFNDLLNGTTQVVSKSSAVTTADASDKRQQQPDSTTFTSTLATTITADGNFDLYKRRCCSLILAKSDSLPREASEVFIPQVDGLSEFKGEVIHSTEYKSGEAYENKKVLVVGAGNSGMEIALDLSNYGAQTSIVVRSPIHILPKWSANHGIILLRIIPLQLVDLLSVLVSKLLYGDITKYGLERPSEGPLIRRVRDGKYPVIDVGAFKKIKSGEIQVLPALKSIKEGNAAVFENGKCYQFDTILFATGFTRSTHLWLQDGDYYFNKDGLPKPNYPNHWKGENGIYCVGLARRGLYGAAADAQNIANHISNLISK